jgi:hypothetical protein
MEYQIREVAADLDEATEKLLANHISIVYD